MMSSVRKLLFCLAVSALLPIGYAEVRLPSVISSGMVIQQQAPVRIWGWADPGENVVVRLDQQTQQTTADTAGHWLVELDAQQADGRPRSIIIEGTNKLTLSDVLVGEVWIGSGQSNMEWPLRSAQNGAAEIRSADYPQIRLFHVPKVQKPQPADDVNAAWKPCTPQNVPGFSAVLYYFGKELHQKLDVPVGLINSSWGGSAIEPWTIKGQQSGKMYNGMIAPLTNLSVRGVTWYQGETNVLQKNGLQYAEKMKDLITGWRSVFRNPSLPFYYVQIAPWSGRYEPGQLPALWEAQTAVLKIPGTGMVVTTDLVDNIADIHPRNKKDVGYRLSLWALAKTYGQKGIVYSGPLYQSMSVEGDRIRLRFAHTADGLKSRDGKPLSEFQIAGNDGQFVAATAEIDGHTVLVNSQRIRRPVHVRFGWHKTAMPNLVNSVGLPASPFHTDNWQGGTGLPQ